MLRSLDNAMCQAYYKIFKTFDHTIALQCQFYMGKLPIELKIALRKLSFLYNIKKSDITMFQVLALYNNEYRELCNKYQLDICNPKTWHVDMWKYFQNVINNI